MLPDRQILGNFSASLACPCWLNIRIRSREHHHVLKKFAETCNVKKREKLRLFRTTSFLVFGVDDSSFLVLMNILQVTFFALALQFPICHSYLSQYPRFYAHLFSY